MTTLFIPKDDKDRIETNLDQDRREAYEDFARQEVPKLKNINVVLAYDYFKYGWDSAIVKYSKPFVKEISPVVKKKIEFTETNLQVAMVMALKGNDKQKKEAREFFTEFLKCL